MDVEIGVYALTYCFPYDTDAAVEHDQAKNATHEPGLPCAFAGNRVAGHAESETDQQQPEGGEPEPDGDARLGEIFI